MFIVFFTNLVDSLVEKLGLGGLPDAPVGIHEQLPSIVEGDLFVLSASATNKRNLQAKKLFCSVCVRVGLLQGLPKIDSLGLAPLIRTAN